MHTETWVEWIRGFFYFLAALILSEYPIYLLAVKGIEAWKLRIKEHSVGESKIKHLGNDIEELGKKVTNTNLIGHDILRRLERAEDDIKDLRKSLLDIVTRK